jgi:hypothetical protein
MVTMKITVFWDVMLCSLYMFTEILQAAHSPQISGKCLPGCMASHSKSNLPVFVSFVRLLRSDCYSPVDL